MSEKNLPIKIFEKRKKVDDRRTEAGGDDALPLWAMLTEDQLDKRVTEFKKSFDTVTERLDSRPKERDFMPVVLELQMHELATAKSHRLDISSFFKTKNQSNLIGYSDERNLLLKVTDKQEILQFNQRLGDTDNNLKAIASVTSIKPYKPKITITNVSKADPIKASLINFHDYQLNLSISKLFENVCKEEEILYKKVDYSPDLIVYRLSNVSQDALEKIRRFDALETIALMPKYSVVTDDVESSDLHIKIKKPVAGKSYPIVGVLDTGIKANPQLKPWILKERFTKVPNDLIDAKHGTFVSGIIVYGDELEENIHIVEITVKVYHHFSAKFTTRREWLLADVI